MCPKISLNTMYTTKNSHNFNKRQTLEFSINEACFQCKLIAQNNVGKEIGMQKAFITNNSNAKNTLMEKQ